MQYQLVLRLPSDAFDDFDQIVTLETALVEGLGNLGMLENHDVGSDECRIVFLTPDPVRAFSESKAVLERERLLDTVVALYRPVGTKEYAILWPRNGDIASADA